MRPVVPTASSMVTPSTRTQEQLKQVHQREYFRLINNLGVLGFHLPSRLFNHNSFAYNNRIRVELIIKGHFNIRGCLRNCLHDDYSRLPQQLLPFFLFIKYDGRRGSQLLDCGFILFSVIYHNYLTSSLTDLSSTNDVSMIFQGYIEVEISNIPHS